MSLFGYSPGDAMLWGVLGKCTNVYTTKQNATNGKTKGRQDCKGWSGCIQLGDQEKLPKKEPLH